MPGATNVTELWNTGLEQALPSEVGKFNRPSGGHSGTDMIKKSKKERKIEGR